MEYKYLVVLSILAVAVAEPLGVQQLCNSGARAAGMGFTWLAVQDVGAAENNIAAIAALVAPALGASADNRFGERAFTTVTLLLVYPTST